MYGGGGGGSSDGESHEGTAQRKIPAASSMLTVRNLRRFIGSEALMELETKRILLDVFKEKQQKSAEAASIPSFYKKKPEEGSISQKVQRLAKYRFLKKQSDLLLNADDLDSMWVCLRENCVIDDATGAKRLRLQAKPTIRASIFPASPTGLRPNMYNWEQDVLLRFYCSLQEGGEMANSALKFGWFFMFYKTTPYWVLHYRGYCSFDRLSTKISDMPHSFPELWNIEKRCTKLYCPSEDCIELRDATKLFYSSTLEEVASIGS